MIKGCNITDEWTYRGMRTLILENSLLKATILLDFGAKLHEFVYKPSNRDFMYHNPRVECRQPVFGANVDNWWTGGMDEAIPTGHPCEYKGEEYPFLGEVWSLPWDYQIISRSKEEIQVHLWRTTVISPLLVEKWITLRQDESVLHFHHKITNLSDSNIEFLWGIHPGFSINSSCRIDLPAKDMLIDESLPDDRLGKRWTRYEWPKAKDENGQEVDMRFIPPPESLTCEFHYATQLLEGWLAITDADAKEGVAMVFDKGIFRSAWLWLVYGGWRGLYTAAVEAWTGYPAKLSEAVEWGKYSLLKQREVLECDTMLMAYSGIGSVKSITETGEVLEANPTT